MERARIGAHVIETKSQDAIRKKIDSFYSNGDALYREISGRDYGVDAILELFNNGNPTGMISLLQIKGTNNAIVPLKRTQEVSCKISSSNASYALQNRIPVILILVSCEPFVFYYTKIQDVLTEAQLRKMKKQKSITVRIPIANCVIDDFEPFFNIVRCCWEQ